MELPSSAVCLVGKGTTRDIGRLEALFMVFAICLMIKLNIVPKGKGGDNFDNEKCLSGFWGINVSPG